MPPAAKSSVSWRKLVHHLNLECTSADALMSDDPDVNNYNDDDPLDLDQE